MSHSKTSLYRHYNAQGKLLYVGISYNALNRLSRHALSSSWYDQIARIDITHFETREAAIEAEKNAIRSENPLFNIEFSLTRTKKTIRPSAPRITDKDVEKYPLVVAEKSRIFYFFDKRWSVSWIADFFGTEPAIINYVLRSRRFNRPSWSVPNIAKPAFEAETEDLLRREFPVGIPSEARE